MKGRPVIELFVNLLLTYMSLNGMRVSATTLNGNYYGPHESCVMASFNATVAVLPIDNAFKGHTFAHISPETSYGRHSECDEYNQYIVWRFDADDRPLNRTHFSLTVGVKIVNKYFELNLHYLEMTDIDVADDLKTFFQNSREKCLEMSANYYLSRVNEGFSYQCSNNLKASHVSQKLFNDYIQNFGEFEVNLHFIRVAKTNSTLRFPPNKHCLLDWILDVKTLIVLCAIVSVLIILCCRFCCCRCRRPHEYSVEENQTNNKTAVKTVLKDSDSNIIEL